MQNISVIQIKVHPKLCIGESLSFLMVMVSIYRCIAERRYLLCYQIRGGVTLSVTPYGVALSVAHFLTGQRIYPLSPFHCNSCKSLSVQYYISGVEFKSASKNVY